MAKLAWLMFTLVLLNSTVKINADFQLITTLAKLIKSVEQMNSSISKINDRLEKLESTIPMKREHIVPDTEPKHGLIDNMIKTLEAEKVFIRKSVSAHEKRFQAFESQMKRHLSTIHTAIDSNKDNIEQQIKLINDTIDKNSEMLEKELILININIDEKADALEQQMVLVNATIDSNKEMVETQIQRINVTIDKHCETLEKELRLINTTLERQYRKQRCSLSHGSLQLYNGNIKLNIAEHDSTVEVKCKNGDKYELKNTETNLYIDSLNTKCLFGHLDKDLSMLKCLPKRCSYSHGSLQLYSGNNQLNIAEHDSTVEVKCKNGDNYDLKNTDTDQYIDSYDTKCLFGHLDKDLRMLKCLPKPCDTNTLSGIDVYRDGIVITGQVRSNVTYSLKCRPPKPRWWELFAAYVFDVGAGEKPEQVERRCENGNFVNVPGCIAKPCDSNNKYIDLYQFRPRNVLSEVSHGAQVSAKCKEDGYEMKDTISGQYLSTFSTKCQYGVFDKDRAYRSLICLPRQNVKYSVRLQVSESRHSGTDDNVFVRIVGNGQTDKFQLLGDFDVNKLVEMNYTGIDVRPIHNVIVGKDLALVIDNHLSLVYVSIYIEDSEEYYVFTGRSLHTWLTSSQPLTLTVSDHPENCQRSHTYGEALYRSPRVRRDPVGMLTLFECKKRCVTSRSLKCKSVYYIPSSRPGQGHCYLNEHSPDDDRYFRDNYSRQTNNGYVSYKRICKTT